MSRFGKDLIATVIKFFYAIMITLTGAILVLLGGITMTWPLWVWGGASSVFQGIGAQFAWLLFLFMIRITVDSPVKLLVDDLVDDLVEDKDE